MNIADFHSSAKEAADLLKALSNDRRLMILCLLSSGEKTVGELEKSVGLRQSALSQHLARLRRDGLVKTRRESQNIYYALVGDSAVRLIETLAGLYCPVEVADPAEEGAA
ncbi:MAG: metalloregulator ArsR/SmtB family transcription factor [Rhodospirillaceae bacterium]